MKDTLRSALQEKAQKTIATAEVAFGMPTKNRREPITVDFWFKLGDSCHSPDPDWSVTLGLLQFTIYSKPEASDVAIVTVAEIIKDCIGEQISEIGQGRHINVHKMETVTLPGPRHGRRVTVVDGSFEYLEEAVTA